MDPAQFQNYMIGLAQQETERHAIQTTREQIRDLIRQTQTCDGSSTSAVRNWIREVTLAFNQVGAASIIEIAYKTVSGPLRFELERFIERTIAANQIGQTCVIIWLATFLTSTKPQHYVTNLTRCVRARTNPRNSLSDASETLVTFAIQAAYEIPTKNPF